MPPFNFKNLGGIQNLGITSPEEFSSFKNSFSTPETTGFSPVKTMTDDEFQKLGLVGMPAIQQLTAMSTPQTTTDKSSFSHFLKTGKSALSNALNPTREEIIRQIEEERMQTLTPEEREKQIKKRDIEQGTIRIAQDDPSKRDILVDPNFVGSLEKVT